MLLYIYIYVYMHMHTGICTGLGDEVLASDSAEELTRLDDEARVRAGVEVGESLYTCEPQAVAVACRSSKMLVLMNSLDAFGDNGGDESDDDEEEEGGE